SAAAFGFRDVLLEDRGAGWYDGSSAVRREARAAARRHKNPLRVHPATLGSVARYSEIVLVTPSGPGTPLQRERPTHGNRQLIVVGARPDQLMPNASGRVQLASLDLEPVDHAPLRLIASIVLAEIARQVGRRSPLPEPSRRPPRYAKALEPGPPRKGPRIEPFELLDF